MSSFLRTAVLNGRAMEALQRLLSKLQIFFFFFLYQFLLWHGGCFDFVYDRTITVYLISVVGV